MTTIVPTASVPKVHADPTEPFVDENVSSNVTEKTVKIGNTLLPPVTPTNTARTPSELSESLPQTHPFRIMIRVCGENAHSSKASKEGNGIYNAVLVGNDISAALKLTLTEGGNYGFHVLNGANNITPSDVILMVDCPTQAKFNAVKAAYRRSRAEKKYPGIF